MKKQRVFAVISAMVLSVSMLFTTGIAAKAEESGVASLTVSKTGYEAISGMYGDTVVAKKNGKYGMAKQDGTEVVPFEYDECEIFNKKTGICVFTGMVGEDTKWYIFNNTGKLLYQYQGDKKNYRSCTGVTVTDTGMIYFMEDNGIWEYGEKIHKVDAVTGEEIEVIETVNSEGSDSLYSYDLNTNNYFIGEYNVSPHASADYHIKRVFYDDGNGKKELSAWNEEYGIPFYANGDYIFLNHMDYLGKNDFGTSTYPADASVYCYQISTGKYNKINSFHMESSEDSKSFGTVGNNIMISNAGSTLYALYDINGKAITKEKYTSIEGTADIKDFYLVSEGEKWFYIDAEGKEYGTDLKDAGCFYGGNAIVLNNDGEAYIIDENFKKVSESVKADVVTSYSDNAFSITVDGLRYPVMMNKAADTDTGVYEVNVTADKAVSAEDFKTLLTENKTKDVAIKTADGITFTFAKGTMKAVDGVDKYDFSASVSSDYSKHTDMPNVSENNFVSLINYNYSGKLPAEASIKIPVGTSYAGQTLYYSQYMQDKSYALVQSVVADAEGYITIKQDHCSTYVVTTEELKTIAEEPAADNLSDVKEPATDSSSNVETPATGDSSNCIAYIILACCALGAMAIVSKRKAA